SPDTARSVNPTRANKGIEDAVCGSFFLAGAGAAVASNPDSSLVSSGGLYVLSVPFSSTALTGASAMATTAGSFEGVFLMGSTFAALLTTSGGTAGTGWW